MESTRRIQKEFENGHRVVRRDDDRVVEYGVPRRCSEERLGRWGWSGSLDALDRVGLVQLD